MFYRAKETSSKIWLSKHGLVAKKLTILDALAPTFIPRRAKYVPILDRHVLSKVFDDVSSLKREREDTNKLIQYHRSNKTRQHQGQTVNIQTVITLQNLDN